MNCKTLNENLLAYVDSKTSDALPEALKKDLDIHIDQCEKCEARVREEINIRSVLSALPVKPMNANFRNRVMDSIKEKQEPKKQYGFFAGFSAAVVASVLIWVTAVYISSPGANTSAIHENSVVDVAEETADEISEQAKVDKPTADANQQAAEQHKEDVMIKTETAREKTNDANEKVHQLIAETNE